VVVGYAASRLAEAGCEVETLIVRDLPAEDLLRANAAAPAIARAVAAVEAADGIVVATPIYKASFSGVLKVFLDVLPQFGLRGKAVLPLATGGGTAHVLAMDYGLRPVLMALDAEHVEPSYVVLDKGMRKTETGEVALEDDTRARLDELAGRFARYLARAPGPSPKAL
jgi:FMN reductase